MTFKSSVFSTLVAAALLASPVLADHHKGVEGSGAEKSEKRQTGVWQGSGKGAHSSRSFYERYDTNKDGVVTKEEFAVARAQGYNRRDSDGDGKVYVEEYVAEYKARLEQQLEEQRKRALKQAEVRFAALDSDDDAIMTEEEFNASGDRMFSRLDSNKDGVINEEDEADQY
ncbi:MAG: hypothetical protein AAGC95_04870 [Pseudomonadota bacterium]